MEIVGQRLRTLRNSTGLSQAKFAKICESKQASINRYENSQAEAPYKLLCFYADYFDVSLDYIFGRTNEPKGKVYNNESEFIKNQVENNAELEKFVEMCFDPKSPMNDKLKKTLISMLKEDTE